MEFGREDMSLLERCLHFRGCYVQAAMELGPLLEKCPLPGVPYSKRLYLSPPLSCVYCSFFPTMPRHNFVKAQPYVIEYCKKYNLEYQLKPIWTAFGDVIRFVC